MSIFLLDPSDIGQLLCCYREFYNKYQIAHIAVASLIETKLLTISWCLYKNDRKQRSDLDGTVACESSIIIFIIYNYH